MKIEPFPWLRDYYVDMNKLYSELTLETIENKVFGQCSEKLKDYKEMFCSDGRQKSFDKGRPGNGENHPREESWL